MRLSKYTIAIVICLVGFSYFLCPTSLWSPLKPSVIPSPIIRVQVIGSSVHGIHSEVMIRREDNGHTINMPGWWGFSKDYLDSLEGK